MEIYAGLKHFLNATSTQSLETPQFVDHHKASEGDSVFPNWQLHAKVPGRLRICGAIKRAANIAMMT